MSNTTKTEQTAILTREEIEEILNPVRLFDDTLDKMIAGTFYPREKLNADVSRFCEEFPTFANGSMVDIFKGFVLGLQRAYMLFDRLDELERNGSDETATTTETTK